MGSGITTERLWVRAAESMVLSAARCCSAIRWTVSIEGDDAMRMRMRLYCPDMCFAWQSIVRREPAFFPSHFDDFIRPAGAQ